MLLILASCLLARFFIAFSTSVEEWKDLYESVSSPNYGYLKKINKLHNMSYLHLKPLPLTSKIPGKLSTSIGDPRRCASVTLTTRWAASLVSRGKSPRISLGASSICWKGNCWKDEERETAWGEVLQLLRKDRQGVKDVAATPNWYERGSVFYFLSYGWK